MILEWGGIVEDLVLLKPHSQMCQDFGVWKNWGSALLSSPMFCPQDKLLSQLGISRPSLGCTGSAAASVGWLDLSGLGFLICKVRTPDPPAQVQWGASEWCRHSQNWLRADPRKLPSHNLQLLFHTWSHHTSLGMRKLTLWFPSWVASMHLFGTAFT